MNYDEIILIAKQGKTCLLPKYDGYFVWDYYNECLMFHNGDFKCKADKLNVSDRRDFYFIT